MGLLGWFQRVGSDPYYASYDKAMQRIKADIEKAKARTAKRRQLLSRTQARFWGSFAVLYFTILAYAAWVLQQPQGKFTAAQHSARVAPVLLAPVAALVLHWLLQRMLGLLGLRDARRVKVLEGKLRRMIVELKDSTHYERTLELLQKYDPDFVPPMPPAALLAGKGQGMGAAGAMVGAPPNNRSAAGLASGTAQGAGSHLFPALGKLWDQAASKLIADDPVMMQLIREARREAEELRARLAAAEAGKAQLAAENRQLRAQLGLPPAQEKPGFAAGAGGLGQGTELEPGGLGGDAAGGGNEKHEQEGGKERESSSGMAAGDSRHAGDLAKIRDDDDDERQRPAAAGGDGSGRGVSVLLASGGVGGGGAPVQDAPHGQEGSEALRVSSTGRRRQ